MIPTVREVLGLPLVRAGRPELLGGRDGLDGAVNWVHISESSDPTGLFKGGELVLTTGLPLLGEPAKVAAYLGILAELGVVGLVVELGTHLTAVPDGLGPAADAAGLPVAALSRPIRFVEVTQQVHQLIVADRYEEVEFARTTHEVFTSLNMARASTTDIVTRASQILGAPLVLEDLNRHVLAFCAAGEPAVKLLGDWAERSRRNESTVDSGWSAVAVGLGQERWARLVLPGDTGNPARAMMVLERAAQSLQLHRMIQQERDALVGQAHGGLLDDLRAGRITDEAEALARAGALGLAADAHYVPLVVRTPRRPQDDAIGKGELDRAFLAAVRRAITGCGHTAIVSLPREGTVVALFSAAKPDPALDAIVETLRQQRLSADAWVAGTARPATGLVRAAQGLAEADHVAEAGLSLGEPRRLFRSTDVRLRGLLTLLKDDHRVQAFAERELGPLLDHDSRAQVPLLPLLRTHLESGGGKARTAELSGLSRPTLYARLRTLERVLGVSLESPESRTSLHVAVMALDSRRD
ncbi:PucR family transcriptional regulator [Amycolatopsis acidicola]|uniref:PucR family transcriptional regulator n=1 Tax=Amycolatopsis acidicola TaxID=2596893 RepID=A0A5N0V076_9PSEU|nr:PucR family transcriptional regulator [Amycolatopsis acidicola]KAA9157465.1 PucR family transcriptional regulator [Amycolatopsis acidicola]